MTVDLPRLADVLSRVGAHRPRLFEDVSAFHAATALIVAEEPVPTILVIRRATRPGDPWSGHAALPGGKREPEDVDLVATARREVHEEVGVELDQPVGRLDDIGGRRHLGVVSPFVFHLPRPVDTVAEPGEVAGVYWMPLSTLVDDAARTRHPSRHVGPWPAWRHEDLVIWGLTHRTLTNFIEVGGLRPG